MGMLPERILLATDGSEDAERASMAAMDLAGRGDADLHVVHVWHDVRGFAHDFVKRELRRQGQEILDEQVRKIEEEGGSVQQAHLRRGRKDQEIVRLAEEIGAGLIVIGSRGRGGVRRALMGSISDSVVRHAHCQVLVVRKEKEQAAL